MRFAKHGGRSRSSPPRGAAPGLGACSAGEPRLQRRRGRQASRSRFLVDNAEETVKTAEALAKAFTAKNPDITVKVETRPGGGEGDNSSRPGWPPAT